MSAGQLRRDVVEGRQLRNSASSLVEQRVQLDRCTGLPLRMGWLDPGADEFVAVMGDGIEGGTPRSRSSHASEISPDMY